MNVWLINPSDDELEEVKNQLMNVESSLDWQEEIIALISRIKQERGSRFHEGHGLAISDCEHAS